MRPVRGRYACHGIGHTRAGRNGSHAQSSRQPCVGLGGERSCLLVTDIDHLYAFLDTSVEDADDVAASEGEQDVDALCLERSGDDLTTMDLSHGRERSQARKRENGCMTDRILVTRRPPGAALDMLRAAGDVWTWPEDRSMPRQELLDRIVDADGLYSMLTDSIDEQLLDAAPRLRVVSTMAVGTDNIDLAACQARSIRVGHTPDVLNETTADTAFALLMAAARRLKEGIDYVRDGHWTRWEPELLWGYDVYGSTIGIIGLGRIGSAIAKRAAGFDMRILYTARRPHPDAEALLGVEWSTLEDLLEESDHVVVATPLTPETRNLIDAQALERMKSTATLVNISRGATVDPRALYVALSEGQIAAAALDVTEPEPIPADDPLLSLPNCTILPHLGSSSAATREAMAELAAKNLIAGLAGQPMPASALDQ